MVAYYLGILLCSAPWLLILTGALWRLKQGERLRRLQLEGAVLLVVSTLSVWIALDPNFGFDPTGEANWSYWLARGMTGLYWIGLLLYILGYFLDSRPHPAARPWPVIGQLACLVSILLGLVLGLVALWAGPKPWLNLPWSVARIAFTLGFYPLAVGYFFSSRRAATL